MKLYSLNIPDITIIEPDIHKDHRGYLAVPISVPTLKELGIDFNIVQINQGYSVKAHTIRGLHFQCEPYSQAKLVSANQGSFISVAVDIRLESPTFGEWCKEIISENNHKVMYVPRGFAHGYLTLEDHTILQYCVDNAYSVEKAMALKYNDPDINIEWTATIDKRTISLKDSEALSLKEFVSQSKKLECF